MDALVRSALGSAGGLLCALPRCLLCSQVGVPVPLHGQFHAVRLHPVRRPAFGLHGTNCFEAQRSAETNPENWYVQEMLRTAVLLHPLEAKMPESTVAASKFASLNPQTIARLQGSGGNNKRGSHVKETLNVMASLLGTIYL